MDVFAHFHIDRKNKEPHRFTLHHPLHEETSRIPLQVMAGSQKCNNMLLSIEHIVKNPVEEIKEFNIDEIAKLIFHALPEQESDESIGFVLTLAEYLTFLADGSIPYPDFKSSHLHAWEGIREFIKCRSRVISNETVSDVRDALDQAQEAIMDLESIFIAARKADGTEAQNLMKIGQSMASDWKAKLMLQKTV